MSIEFVKLAASERLLGQKDLLESQLSSLEMQKSIKEFKRLRKEELILKIALMNKVDEIQKELELLDKLLPKTDIKIKSDHFESDHYEDHEKNHHKTLEDEIDAIRRKLEYLQS